MALRLRALGFPRAFALQGGFAAWMEAGYPTEPLVGGDPAQNAVDHQPL